MGLISGTKRILKPLVNFPVWMNTKAIAENGQYVVDLAKRTFTPRKAELKETFEEAMVRQGVSEKDLLLRKRTFGYYSLLFLLVAIFVYSYAAYQFAEGFIRAGAISCIMGIIALILAFRYSLWRFQIQRRMLGCTFREWFSGFILRRKS